MFDTIPLSVECIADILPLFTICLFTFFKVPLINIES